MEQFWILLAAILLATGLNIFLKKFDLPTAIGYIFTGIIIANILHLNVHNSEVLQYISELGIVLLMFTIGLEFSFQELKIMKKEVFFYGAAQVLISGLFFASLTYLLGFELKTAIIIGFALSLSSTAIVLKILNENGDIHASYGRKALGVLLFQDIAVIPLLLMIEIFTKDVSLTTLLLQTLMNMIFFFLLLYLLGHFVIDRFLQYAVTTKTQEIFLLAIFFIIFLSAELAHFFGFSYSLGAFFAGMLLAESKYKYQVEADLAPFRDLLLGVFFFSVGNRINFIDIMDNLFLIIAATFTIMLLKALLIFLILFKFEQKRTAFKTALALSQVGEFSLALFLLANYNNLLDNHWMQILSSIVIISMILTPFVLKKIKILADRFFKEPTREIKIVSTGLKNHVIVCGYGPLGKRMCEELKRRNFEYVIIEHDLALYEEALAKGEPIFFGNAAQRTVLESLDLKNAIAVVITFHNLEKIRLVSQSVLDLAPHAHIVARVRDEKEAKTLEDLHIKSLVITTQTLAKEMIQQLFYCTL
ncbi:cation:proton antiporter [Nitratiruptor sp. YY09-18]|uniref:cation:proton antiporter n=1 Tax=Nitratiruptor sp. YY09-18 TaxID=2724901 RepID=UPI0019152BB0|nr:cation:proton antiporter [Nitratiruptor sp. YY09-18]BCD68624.1 monovalent cation:H+ antiporter-2, CPA2 family [Nitratiruptor sp. YY09-18]